MHQFQLVELSGNVMKNHRINDPIFIEQAEIAQLIGDGNNVTVQFSKPTFTIDILKELNELSKSFGSELAIRFYGTTNEFDGSVLQHIPDASNVSIDCLTQAKNLESISLLRNLKKFTLGVFEMDAPDVLSEPSLRQVKSLILGSTRKSNIDLSSLANFKNLESFHTTGHTRNLETLTKVPYLRKLSLSQIKSNVSISFVSDLQSLTDLMIILGGRDSIEEIEGEHIKKLEIIRVKGLARLGNLGRFKALEDFSVEDQIRLEDIKFDKSDLLRSIKILNCKTLQGVHGLNLLKALKHLRIYETSIDYEKFISQKLPDSLKILGFYTAKKKRDEAIKNDLKLRGYSEF